MQVAIYSPVDGAWFDGLGFNVTQSTPYFLSTSTSSSATVWTYAPASLDLRFIDHRQYTIVTQATDIAGNSQSTYVLGTSSETITIDRSAPVVTLLGAPIGGASYQPANIGEVGSGTRFHGTVTDPTPLASGVNPTSGVQIQLSYIDSGGTTYYWDANITQFSSFTVTATSAWFNAGSSWLYIPSIVWPTDASHLITLQTRGTDNASLGDGSGGGNVSVPQSVSFNVDFVVPSGTITYPSANQPISSATIQMTGSESDDLSGVNLTQVEISTGLGASKNYWTGSGWTTSQTWITTTTANPWFYTIPAAALASGNLYYLRLQLTDVAGNVFTGFTSTFTYDTQAPTVTISSPVASGFYSNVFVSTPFAGTAVDNGTNATGVSTVTLTLQDVTGAFNVFTSSPAQGNPANWTYQADQLAMSQRPSISIDRQWRRRQRTATSDPRQIFLSMTFSLRPQPSQAPFPALSRR